MKPADMHRLLDDVIKLLPNGSAQEVFLHAAMVAEMAGKYAAPAPVEEKPAHKRVYTSTYLRARGFGQYPTFAAAAHDLVNVQKLTEEEAAAKLDCPVSVIGRALRAAAEAGLSNGVHR